MRNNIRLVRVLMISVVLAAAGVTHAAEPYVIRAYVYSTPAEQWRAAQAALREFQTATTLDDRRQSGFSAAILLEQIPKQWPTDVAYVMPAVALACEIYTSLDAPQKIIDLVTGVEPLIHDANSRAHLHVRLSRAYSRLGRSADAKRLLLAAEGEADDKNTDGVAFEVSRQLGEILTRSGDWTEAAKRLRRAASLAGDDVNRAQLFLQAARVSATAGDKAAAKRDADAASEAIGRAKTAGGSARPGLAAIHDNIEDQIRLLRSKHKL